MASIPELHVVDHWRYKAEGNANLVLQYIGPDPRFSSTVLRLRKADRVYQPALAREDSRLHAQSESAVKDLGKEMAFQSQVMALLLGGEFVEHLVLVSLPRTFLENLAAAIEPVRPPHRLQKGIDLTRETGFLSLDHTRFIHSQPSNPTVAVELKPKWGYLPAPHFLPDSAATIKRRKCRFCMYQYLKALEAKEQELSTYCPIDLFSSQEGLVQYALDALVKTPQNNLRLFVNGDQKPVTQEGMDQALGSIPLVPATTGAVDDGVGVSVNVLLTEILTRSPFLTRLSRLQQGMDYLDVEVIHRFYDSLVASWRQQQNTSDAVDEEMSKMKKNAAAGLPEPTVDEYLNAAEAFLERSGLDTSSPQGLQETLPSSSSSFLSQEEFEERLRTSVGFEPNDDLDADVPDAIKMHYLREFLLAATLKDCSLIVTVERILEGQQQQDSQETNDVSDSGCSVGKGAGISKQQGEQQQQQLFHERQHIIKMGGQAYRYKMVCIDLDPKKINAIPRYLDKDRQTVSHYLRVVGDRGEACGSR